MSSSSSNLRTQLGNVLDFKYFEDQVDTCSLLEKYAGLVDNTTRNKYATGETTEIEDLWALIVQTEKQDEIEWYIKSKKKQSRWSRCETCQSWMWSEEEDDWCLDFQWQYSKNDVWEFLRFLYNVLFRHLKQKPKLQEVVLQGLGKKKEHKEYVDPEDWSRYVVKIITKRFPDFSSDLPEIENILREAKKKRLPGYCKNSCSSSFSTAATSS